MSEAAPSNASPASKPTVDLASYDHRGYRPGRGPLVRVLWYLCNALLFCTWLLPLSGPKRRLLRLFGANPVTGERGPATARVVLEPDSLVVSYEHQIRVDGA